jgi:hypothetical protein
VTGEVDSGPTQIKVGDSVAVAGPELTSNGLLIANTIDLGVVKIRGYIENSFKDGWIVNDNGAIRSLTLDRRNPPVDGHGAPLNIDLLRALFIAGRHVHVLGVPERDGSIRVIRFLIPRDRLTPK